LKYDELVEFDDFIQMKYVYPLQLRHTKDHIELTNIQTKYLNKLNFISAQLKEEELHSYSTTSSLSVETS
jgi:hypothetical protein